MLFYFICFVVTYILSATFAVGGVGSAIVLIPALHFLGIGFDLAKAVGLFVNTVTTSTASWMNYKRKFFDVRFTIPFLITSALFAPLGAYATQLIDVYYVKLFFVLFLFFSSYLLVIKKTERNGKKSVGLWVMCVLGIVVGFMSGLLGIGGGALIIPALSFMKFDPKKIAVMVSFMIPFSTLSAFLSYVFIVEIDWILIFVTTVAALLGGYSGNRIMHVSLKDNHLKYGLAAILSLVALKMAWDLTRI